MGGDSLYGESIDTRRAELIGKYGFTKNLLLEYSYNYHWQYSYYGTTWYKASQHTAFAQLRWDKTFGRHNLLAGIPFRYLWYDDNTPATFKQDGNAPSIQTMNALYVQDEIRWNKSFTTLAGIRYEHSNLQGGVVAPRLALKWQPEEHHTIRLSAGNGFRIVNLFTEDHAALSGFREIVIKNDLKPEKSWNANLNYSGDMHLKKGVLGWDISAFYTWFTNKIIPDYATDPNKIIYDNLDGFAISKGISGQLNLTLQNGLRAMAGITYMDVYAVEKEVRMQQVYAPKWSGNYSISYLFRKPALSFDITGKWNGPMLLPVAPNDFRPEYSPWYNLLNFQATKKWSSQLETYVSVKNLLNFIPENPLLHPDDPFDRPGGKYWNADGTPNAVTNPNGYTFDPSYNYAPMQGIKLMVGIRVSMN
jgi:outer membrane receptor for ferrienterochelin and colicins